MNCSTEAQSIECALTDKEIRDFIPVSVLNTLVRNFNRRKSRHNRTPVTLDDMEFAATITMSLSSLNYSLRRAFDFLNAKINNSIVDQRTMIEDINNLVPADMIEAALLDQGFYLGHKPILFDENSLSNVYIKITSALADFIISKYETELNVIFNDWRVKFLDERKSEFDRKEEHRIAELHWAKERLERERLASVEDMLQNSFKRSDDTSKLAKLIAHDPRMPDDLRNEILNLVAICNKADLERRNMRREMMYELFGGHPFMPPFMTTRW